MNNYFEELDKIFDRREEEHDTEAAEQHKLDKIRLIVEDKITASNAKIEQIREVLEDGKGVVDLREKQIS